MTLIAEVFLKLRSPKNLVRSMSIKSRFKGTFGKQHGKRSQILLKFPWQHLYDIYWLLWRQLSYKKSLLVICKIARLFPNTLSADGKYTFVKRDNLRRPIQMQVYRKQKTFSEFFSAFLKSNSNFESFLKTGWLSSLRYFRSSGPRKTWLVQCRKSPVSRDPSKSNIVNAPDHCWNVKESSFSIFIDHC